MRLQEGPPWRGQLLFHSSHKGSFATDYRSFSASDRPQKSSRARLLFPSSHPIHFRQLYMYHLSIIRSLLCKSKHCKLIAIEC